MIMIVCPRFQEVCEKIYREETGEVTSDISEIVRVAKDKIFDFDYEIFDSAYKPVLETKIIKHYYLRRLCVADYEKWKLFIENIMNEIMPYYNQFYKAEALEINPLYNFKINVTHTDSGGDTLQSTTDSNKNVTENTSSTNENSDNIAKDIKKTGTFQNESTSTRNKDITTESNITNKSDTSAGTTTQNESNATRNNTDTSSSVNKFNDTPQGRLSDIKSGEYLTDARVIDDNKSSDETAVSKGKELVTGKTVNVSSGNDTSNSNEKNQDKDNEKGNNSNSEIGTITRTNNTTTSGTNTTGETGNISKSEELTTNRQYVEEVLGVKEKSQSELLMKYRESFINIDMMIIKELGQIFDSRLYIQDYLPQSFDNETDWGDLF